MLDYQESYVISDLLKKNQNYTPFLRVLGVLNSDVQFGTGTGFACAMTILSN